MDEHKKKEIFAKFDSLGFPKVMANHDSLSPEEQKLATEWSLTRSEIREAQEVETKKKRERWDTVRSWLSLSVSTTSLIISGLVAYYAYYK